MQFDPTQHSGADGYKLLTNLVVPRPIAWISSVGASGVVNLAPFSFFNAVSGTPPYIVVGIGRRDNGEMKDTARNIESGGDFVVNFVTEDLLAAMNISAVDFPPDTSEAVATGLHTSASVQIAAPRLREAHACLECRLHQIVPLGGHALYIAEVVMFHVDDALMGPRFHVNDFAPIGRMGSPSVYCRTTDRFNLDRLNHAQWLGKSAG